MNTIIRKAAFLLLPLALVSAIFLTPVQAQNTPNPAVQATPVPCGDGYASEQYGFSYALQQPHWTIGWEGYVSESTIDRVDAILDDLNDDQIAQTMILFKPEDEVGNRVNCAVHFLRYMRLGLPQGERKDNGFTFLIVVGEDDIDVHYGVGLGLPALTAQGLTPLNRLAEDTYENTGSMDEAYLALIQAYDEYARSKYEPYRKPQATAIQFDATSLTTTSGCITACLICVVTLVVLIIIVAILRLLFRGGGGFSGGRRRYPMFPSSRPFSGWSGRSSRRWSPPRMRGGGGSGRSNRGN